MGLGVGVGLGDGDGAGVAPTPVSATECGEPAASSVNTTDADAAAAAVGANTTPRVQVAAIESVVTQVLFAMLNCPEFVPDRATPLTVSGDVPAFVTVIVCELVADTSTFPKSTEVGTTEKAGIVRKRYAFPPALV